VAVSPGREYRQGHDAKHKSALLNAAVGPDRAAAARARKAIASRGWDGHLAIREAMIAKAAAKKAGRRAAGGGAKAAGARPAAPAAPKPPARKRDTRAAGGGTLPDLRLASERTPDPAV